MTYTEQDLRAVLGALESDAPDVADTLAGVDRLRRRRTVRRRTAGLAAVAAVTVALVAGTVAVPGLVRSNDESTTVGAGAGLRYRFAVDDIDIPGARVHFDFVGAEHEMAYILKPGGGYPIMIDVFARGGYDPTKARVGEAVDVNGRRGFYLEQMPCPCSANPPGAGIAWEYEPDSWVLVHWQLLTKVDREELLGIARAVRFDRTTPVRVPFRVGYLPDGVHPTGAATKWSTEPYVTVGLSGPGDQQARLHISAGPKPKEVRPDLKLPPGTRPADSPSADLPKPKGMVDVDLGEILVNVSSAKPGLVSEEELKKIAASITAAGGLDPATWIEADKAFPTS